MNRKSQSDILDQILTESQEGRGEVVWQPDPNHPNGGYYVEVKGCSNLSEKLGHGTLDDIERYLRS